MGARKPALEERFLAAVDEIFASAVNGAGWEPALARIAEFVGAQSADFSAFDARANQMLRWEHARVDADSVAKYSNDYMNVDNVVEAHPRMPILVALPEGQSISDDECFPLKERRRMAFFTDMLWPQGIRDSLMTSVRRQDGRPYLYLGLFTSAKHAVTDEMRRHARILLPYLRRAAGVEERLAGARKEAATLAFMLDRMSTPVLLVDASGKLVRANQAALDVLRCGAGVTLARDERLIFASPERRDEFSKALAQCSLHGLVLRRPESGPPTQIIVRRFNRRPLVLTLQPLPRDLGGTLRAVALLFIADPDARPTDAQAALRAAYDLSPTEARLVQALCDGMSLKEFALRHRVSYETVRSHIRRIFLKTGTGRQSALIRLAQGLH